MKTKEYTFLHFIFDSLNIIANIGALIVLVFVAVLLRIYGNDFEQYQIAYFIFIAINIFIGLCYVMQHEKENDPNKVLNIIILINIIVFFSGIYVFKKIHQHIINSFIKNKKEDLYILWITYGLYGLWIIKLILYRSIKIKNYVYSSSSSFSLL